MEGTVEAGGFYHTASHKGKHKAGQVTPQRRVAMSRSADLSALGRLGATLGMGWRRHPRSLCSVCLSCPQPPMTLGLFRRALILSHPCPRLGALPRHGAWGSRPRVATSRGAPRVSWPAWRWRVMGVPSVCTSRGRSLGSPRHSGAARKRSATRHGRPSRAFSARRPPRPCGPSGPTPIPPAPKRQGARPGHPGAGRQAFDVGQAERIVDRAPAVGARCPGGHALSEDQGTDNRAVLERRPVQAERLRYRLPQRSGPGGRRTCQPRAPALLPKRLSGTPRLATATTRPDLHGLP